MKKQALSINESTTREQNFESLFLHSELPKIIFTYEGDKILNVNDAALKLYGYTRTEFLNLHPLDLSVRKSRDWLHKRAAKVNNGNGPTFFKSLHVTKKNKILSVILRINIFFYNGNISLLVSIRDVTEKKHLKEKIKKDKLSLQKKIRAAVNAVKENEIHIINDALNENINQILAGTKMYLVVARSDKESRLQLIEKSEQNIKEAMNAIKQLYIALQDF